MSDDDRLRQRLAATDPVRTSRAAHPPTTSADIRERIMATLEHDTDTPDDGAPMRTRSTRTLLAAAAAALVLVAGAVVGAVSLTGGSSGEPAPTALRLEVPPGDIAGSCIQFDVAFLREMPVAFAGTVTRIGGETVSLDVDRWYAGGTADQVILRVPGGESSAALVGLEFVDGGDYLVAATDGTVNGCGFSGPATPELEQAYEQAFGG
jgi:hypothetical protein